MTQYVLSLSYGKDSMACLEAIKQLGWPLDRIVTADVWATEDIPADLPPMVEFKAYADKIIKDRYGITVEHVCARPREREREVSKLSYELQFYRGIESGKNAGRIYGFPHTIGPWCNSRLKVDILRQISNPDLRANILSYSEAQGGQSESQSILGFPIVRGNWCNTYLKTNVLRMADTKRKLVYPTQDPVFSDIATVQGERVNIVQYLGIAADEPERIKRHTKDGVKLPLVEIGWDETYCRQWCEENGLLSPIYTDATRGGCWFCHNQGVDQLRKLRNNYPDLWQILLKWDKDSPTTFKPDGHTVHDFDMRFKLEETDLVPTDRRFRWKMLDKYREQQDENPAVFVLEKKE